MAEPVAVLHVDDDPMFCDLVADFLARESDRISVTTETDPEDGLDTLRADGTDVDCVVSDYDMPGRNGLAFLAAVRESHPDLPFILFTGKGSEEVASDAISAGVTEYMQKERSTDQYAVLANRIENSVDQYRARREAERTRRRLAELTGSSVDCLWMFDRDWEELLFISGYEEVWNRPTEAIEADPQDFLNGVDPDHRDRVRAAMDRLSNGESIDIEYRILRGDGETGWVWVKGEPIFEDGEVVRVVGFTRDVTDRKRKERELREERDFVEQALNALEDVFYVVGTDGTLRRWNDRLEAVTGYTADELAGADVTDLFPESEHGTVTRAIDETLRTGETTVRAAFETADGERVPHEFTGARLTDPDGELVGLVGIARDTADREA